MKQIFYIYFSAVFITLLSAFPASSATKDSDTKFICISEGGKPSLFVQPAIFVMRYNKTTMKKGNRRTGCRLKNLTPALIKDRLTSPKYNKEYTSLYIVDKLIVEGQELESELYINLGIGQSATEDFKDYVETKTSQCKGISKKPDAVGFLHFVNGGICKKLNAAYNNFRIFDGVYFDDSLQTKMTCLKPSKNRPKGSCQGKTYFYSYEFTFIFSFEELRRWKLIRIAALDYFKERVVFAKDKFNCVGELCDQINLEIKY